MTVEEDIKPSRGDYEEKWAHIKRKYLIISTKDYIVVIDEEENIDWETSPEYDEIFPSDKEIQAKILNDAALLETFPCTGIDNRKILHYKRLIGEGIARSLGGQYDGARAMLEAADKYIKLRSEEISRLWYLSYCLKYVFIIDIFAVMIWLIRDFINATFGNGFALLFVACAFGATGALLSVIGRSGNLHFDCAAGEKLHELEAFSRILAGLISGCIVSLAVKSEMIFAPFAKHESFNLIILIAAFAGGTGERLVGSIISKFEEPAQKTTQVKTHPNKAEEIT